jgi:hypothetical protein
MDIRESLIEKRAVLVERIEQAQHDILAMDGAMQLIDQLLVEMAEESIPSNKPKEKRNVRKA